MKLTTFAAVSAALATSAFAQLPTTKMLTLDVAQTIAQEAMARCRADGYKVTVLVVDGLNAPKAIGAVAVSGAPGGDKDAACANAGIAKAAGQLK